MKYVATIETKDITEYWIIEADNEDEALIKVVDVVYTATPSNTDVRFLGDYDVAYAGCNYKPLI